MRIRRSVWILPVFAMLAISTIPLPSLARTWHIAPDSTSSTSVIHAAIDSASYGDTVLVAPGTYVRTDDPDSDVDLAPGISLVSECGSDVTILEFCDTSLGILLIRCEGARVSGFTVRHGPLGPDCGNAMGEDYGIVCNNCTDVVIEDCVIERLDHGISVNGESLEWGKPVVRNNTIRDCSYGISCSAVVGPSRPLFEGNTITGCGKGAEIWNSEPDFESCEIINSWAYGLVYIDHCGGNVNKCTIAHTHGTGVYVWCDPPLAAPWFNGSWLHENANDFYDNAGWDIWYRYTGDQGLMMAPYDYWGSDCPNFAGKIYGRVIYTPWMDSTHTQVFDEDDCPPSADPCT
jgi:hypothetical protein